VRAEPKRDGGGLGRVAAEHARLVRRGRDDAARAVRPDEQRLARELRPVEHLDRREERVHVDVEDGTIGGHARILTASRGRRSWIRKDHKETKFTKNTVH
jgi:hypothetical protein